MKARHGPTIMKVRRGVIVLLMLASLASGPFGATAAPARTVAAAADASGSVTIADHGSYSDVSQVASDTSQMSCKETITVHQDGSASETISYSYRLVDEQASNGYESKRTVDITGSGSVQYDPQLFVTIDQDGTYDLGFGVSDPGITAQEIVTSEATGQQTRTIQTTTHVHCAYNPSLLRGKLSGGQVLKNTVDEYGHWNTDEDHDDYGPSTVAWTITDPAARGVASSGPPGPVPMPQVLLYGSVEIDDHGSYSSTASGLTITSQMTCKETITVHQDGSATEAISYSYHRVEDQTSNGYETRHTIDTSGSGTVQYDPELTAAIDPNGTYYLSFGTDDPGILVQATSTIETTGQQAQTVQATISVHCAYNPSLLQGTLRLPCGQVLQITVTKDGHWNTDEDHDDYGPSTLIVDITDPSLSCGTHASHGSVTATATATPTETATATPTPGNRTAAGCSVVKVPAPKPVVSAGTAGKRGLPARLEFGAQGRAAPAVTVIWGTRSLIWSDFRGIPPKTGPLAGYSAATISKPGTTYSVKSCWEENPASGLYTSKIRVNLRKGHAAFLAAQSWVKRGDESPTLLDHESRHFDITEVYSRKAANSVVADFKTFVSSPCSSGCMKIMCPGEALCVTLACAIADKATCNQEADDFLKRIKDDYDKLINLPCPTAMDPARGCDDLSITQDQYDAATDHGLIAEQQRHWDSQIAQWLRETP